MQTKDLKKILEEVRAGSIEPEDAARPLRARPALVRDGPPGAVDFR